MNRRLQTIGIVLVLLAMIGFAGWELWGKNMFETTEVIVAKEEIPEGTELDLSLFTTITVDKSVVTDGAVTPDTINRIRGKYAEVTIPKNAQITDSFLRDESEVLLPSQSVFVLKGEWISLRSSSLRRGDFVDIYALDADDGAHSFLGRFRIAFVKDSNEAEVQDPSDLKSSDFFTPDILTRSSSTSIVNQVEIIATYEEYTGILEAVRRIDKTCFDASAGSKGSARASLMLVQVMGTEVSENE